jgi:hypothetical protein
LERSNAAETLNQESGGRPLTLDLGKETTMRKTTRSLLRRLDSWTRWAFNPQPELTSRYDRG